MASTASCLEDRISKARNFATDPASRTMLDAEQQVVEQYLKAGGSLVNAIVHAPTTAAAQLGPYLQLYKDLQGKIELTSDQMEKGAKDSEISAAINATRATRASLVICGTSLLLLLLIATKITLGITRPLDAFSIQFEAMTEANDLTSRLDELRHDEIGQLGRCLNRFIEKVHDTLGPIAQTAQGVASASEELSTTSQQITANSEETTVQAQGSFRRERSGQHQPADPGLGRRTNEFHHWRDCQERNRSGPRFRRGGGGGGSGKPNGLAARRFQC